MPALRGSTCLACGWHVGVHGPLVWRFVMVHLLFCHPEVFDHGPPDQVDEFLAGVTFEEVEHSIGGACLR